MYATSAVHEATPLLLPTKAGDKIRLALTNSRPSPSRASANADAQGATKSATATPTAKLRSEVAHSLALRHLDSERGSFAKTAPPNTMSQTRIAIRASLVMNLILACAKTYAAIVSGSLAVLSSLVDSILDLVSQWLFWYSDKHIHTPHTKYPAGRQRLEPIAVIISATLMGMAAIEVVQQSMQTLLLGIRGIMPIIDMSTLTISVLVVVVLVKIALWVVCARIGKYSSSASALAQDHRNDVFSNVIAITTCLLAHWRSRLWYVDPIGAIAISIYIAVSWLITGKEQVERLIGLEADQDFIEEVKALAAEHHPLMQLDTVRAYHFGSNYIAELEVILPASMCVSDAHDISLALQRTVESKHCVERAFVHVDYCSRDYDEHKDPTVRQEQV